MIVTVLYPNHEGAKFDGAYYKATHAELAKAIWNPDRVELIEGVAPGGGTPPYALIAHFHFASPEAMGQAMANPRMGELQADVANFTDITPAIMIGKPL
ncbi:EthD family reductase [uncultured Sphingomonas sp.]|mgnify:CR=1 FL=1|jgi:uncharacterized protein (TIGR02118 family)|uniref:EthD family reductase n=1 Tax=unclassified Sphingomonas TaxID=196159 RepID=UPI0025E89869|nr:EthD family reductase [uncultured Sphingomonas sp.]